MSILLKVEETLTALQSKQQFEHIFVVEKPLDQLTVEFKYSPKELEDAEAARQIVREALPQFKTAEELERGFSDNYLETFLPLKNLLTVSLDDPNGFRGSAHRQPPEQQLIITEETASPGFIPGSLPTGEWKLTISAHCVVTLHCHYSLRVVRGDEA